VDGEVVAIDGKTVRGSFDRSRDQGPLHIVSAWASERGLVLGQRQVGDKSNEITAVPELLDTLDLKGSIHNSLSAHLAHFSAGTPSRPLRRLAALCWCHGLHWTV
jgi:hypothetical protein